MLEELQNNCNDDYKDDDCQQDSFNIERMFALCENIIRRREFKSLFELSSQCNLFYGILQNLSYNPQDDNSRNISDLDDSIFILLYYIYYILLDEKERNIFIPISKLILWKNMSLQEIYETTDSLQNIFDTKYVPIEEMLSRKIALLILDKYSNCFSEENKKSLQMTFSELNNFIYFAHKNGYDAIPNDFYLFYLLGFGLYKDNTNMLTKQSEDILNMRFDVVVDCVMENFKQAKDNSIIYDENFITNDINNQVEELRF